MSCEINFSSVDFDDFDKHYESSVSQMASSGENLHEAIFCVRDSSFRLERTVNFKGLCAREERILGISRNHRIAPMGKVSGEVGVSIDWGGERGTEVSGYASGSASDDRGNRAEVKVEVNGDGSGKATASASHDEDTGS